MGCLSAIVRETYAPFAGMTTCVTSLDKWEETEPPIIGDLEPSSVIESTYFLLIQHHPRY